jgi:hypothetical protein
MIRRALALLLVLSWVALSGVDALEDLDFDSHTIGKDEVFDWASASQPVKLANNILELANSKPLGLGRLFKCLDFESTAPDPFGTAYPAAKALRSHKEHRVLLI